MKTAAVLSGPTACVQCSTELPMMALACTKCGTLVHNDELMRLAADAEKSAESGDASTALLLWHQAINLVPPGTEQHKLIMSRVTELGTQVRASRQSPELAQASKKPTGWLAGLGTLGLFLWKFKFILVFLLTKGKLLLLGLTKASTFVSMFAAFGLYWALWGWKFAAGIVLTTYVHEMGHVFAFRRYGIPATAPMFIPGFGAYVRGQAGTANEVEDAHISLAGPLWGGLASLACFGLFYATGNPVFLAITHLSALINLFNLLPFSIFDGNRALQALTQRDRWMVAATGALAAVLSHSLMVLLISVLVLVRSFGRDMPEKSDRETFFTWVVLLLGLGFLASVTVPGMR